MKAPVNYRRFNYDRTLLPNRHLAELDTGITTLEEAEKLTGYSVGYPGWNLLYYAILCHLDPKSFNVIIETGTNVGCSTIILAQALKDSGYDGHIYTIEKDAGFQAKAVVNIKAADLTGLVTIMSGDSRTELPKLIGTLSSKIRVAFLDASHLFVDALSEFETVLPVLATDGIIIFDNTYSLADPGEDPRVNGALREIQARHGGNLVNFPYASWCTPGIAIWQKTPLADINASDLNTLNTLPETSNTQCLVSTDAPSTQSTFNHAASAEQDHDSIIDAVGRFFPAINTDDVIRGLNHMLRLQTTIEGRCCGDVGDRLAQYCAWIQYLRDYPNNTKPQGIEIGTLFGGSCALILNAIKDENRHGVITCIDPMQYVYGERLDICGIAISPEVFYRNIEKSGFSKQWVNLKRSKSQEPNAYTGISDKTCGVLLIDGDHTRNGVLRDWNLYKNFVAEGGFVLFDDYGDTAWPELTPAVDAIVSSLPSEWTALGQLGTTFILRRALSTASTTHVSLTMTESIRILLEALSNAQKLFFLPAACRIQESAIINLLNKNEHLATSIANNETRISQLTTENTSLTAETASLTNKITYLTNDTESLKTDITLLMIGYIRSRWEQLKQFGSVELFGAGKHTRWLLSTLRKDQTSIISQILDENPELAGKNINGIPVVQPSKDKKERSIVVLSSDTNQSTFRERCRQLLPNNTTIIDLYEGIQLSRPLQKTSLDPKQSH